MKTKTKMASKIILTAIKKESIFYCADCDKPIQAGGRWVKFCPHCLKTEQGFDLPTHVMSCCHCEQPLVIKETEDGRTVGRCNTAGCGDCYSMQDLTLITRTSR